MVEISRPWSGIAVGDAGPYSAEQWADLYKNLFHALTAGRGPIIDSGTAPNVGLQVQATAPASTDIDVLPGAALVEGTFYQSSATETLAIAANVSGNPRIDTVVLQKDYVAQTVRLAVLTGVPAVTPSPTALTQTDGVLWEIPLADIAVASGFASITNADITPRYEWANAADGVYLKDVYNHSGQTLVTGDVVVWDDTADRAVTITTIPDDPKTAGVWVGRTANGAYGRVLKSGIGYVKVGTLISRGDHLGTGTTGTEAADFNLFGRLGIALQSSAGAGLILAVIDVRNQEHYIHIRDQKNSGSDGGTFTSGAWQTRDLNTEVVDAGGYASVAANQITLLPGTYRCRIQCPAFGVGKHQARLYDTTGAATLLIGTSQRNASANALDAIPSIIVGRFTLTVASVLEVRHRCETTLATTGFGQSAGFDTEVYTTVEFWREA